MKTQIVPAHSGAELARAVARAVRTLRAGEAVALPTETVYGLAADALNPSAVLKIFQAKERPRFDPLIVHLPSRDWLPRIARTNRNAERLVEKFWPGPLTIVLPRTDIVPDLVTSGLDTVAVRLSAHPVFGGIAAEFDRPLAAPSANRFGRISPTSAEDVADELRGRVSLIVDAGRTTLGIESTIVALSRTGIRILREGPITREQLARFGRVTVARRAARPIAPGQLRSHYAPRTPMKLIDDAQHAQHAACDSVGFLAWNAAPRGSFAAVRVLSRRRDLNEAATNLFRMLRELDSCALDLILAERVPDRGIGSAIMDRLRRAAAKRS